MAMAIHAANEQAAACDKLQDVCAAPYVEDQTASKSGTEGSENSPQVMPNNPHANIGILKLNDSINEKAVEQTIKKLHAFLYNPTIDAIIFVINSGGGDAGLAELLSREIALAASKKPLVTLITGLCCSGAYWAAVASPYIIAPGASVVGHIGSVIEVQRHFKPQVKNDSYSADAQYEYIHGGEYKIMLYPQAEPLTEKQRSFLQKQADEIYEMFYTLVAQKRNLSLDTRAQWANGQAFAGKQALALGLIDQIGGFSDALCFLTNVLEQNSNRTYEYPPTMHE